MIAPTTELKSYIIVPFGNRRFSVAAHSVIELISPGKLQKFPHRTSWISGVIVRRNRVIPVCDVVSLLGGTGASICSFYLVAEWGEGDRHDWCAIPVAGECELTSAEAITRVDDESEKPYMAGFFQVGRERIQILDLTQLINARRIQHEAKIAEASS